MHSMTARLWAFGTAAVTLSACAEDVPVIYIERNQGVDEACDVSTSAQAVRSQGVLDVLMATEYFIDPLLRSTLVPSQSVEFRGLTAGAGGLQGINWEASRITLTRATVELDIPAAVGVPVARSFVIPISGGIEPSAQTSVSLQVIQPNVVNLLRSSPLIRQSGASPVTMLARVRVEGKTSAGNRVGSNEFTFPISICYGCLLDVPPEAVDRSLPTPNCLAQLETELPSGSQCRRGQDRPVDCRVFCPTLSPDAEDLTGICIPR
jgi:hypothetical protein